MFDCQMTCGSPCTISLLTFPLVSLILEHLHSRLFFTTLCILYSSNYKLNQFQWNILISKASICVLYYPSKDLWYVFFFFLCMFIYVHIDLLELCTSWLSRLTTICMCAELGYVINLVMHQM